jgi:hypothetical protein
VSEELRDYLQGGAQLRLSLRVSNVQ